MDLPGKIRTVLALLVFLLLSTGTAHAQYDINRFFDRGRQALVEGRYPDAIDNFNILIRLDKSLYEAYFFRGIAKYNLGDFVGAEMDFDSAIEINPVYTAAYHYRGITRSRVGKYDSAIEDLDMAVELRPDYIGLYFSRGVAYFLSRQFDKAVADFNRFIRREPREPDAYLNRGASCLFLGDTLAALKDYNKAISLNRLEPEGYIRRSRLYYMQGRIGDALSDLDRAVSLDTANTFAYFNRALIRYEEKDFMGALSDLDRVLAKEPGNALTLYNRALIRSQLGDYDRALEDYDMVLNINPENVLAYYNRAALFVTMGRYYDAIDDYTMAISLYPDFAKAYLNRSYVRNMIGDYVSAQADYRTASDKIEAYRLAMADSTGRAAFADTTRKYDHLLALDSDFAKDGFGDGLLQNRNVDIKLKPMYKFVSASSVPDGAPVLIYGGYQDNGLSDFIASVPVNVALLCRDGVNTDGVDNARLLDVLSKVIESEGGSRNLFAKAILESEDNHFNAALEAYNEAIEADPDEVFYYLNRGALQSDMIDFISSIESNVQVLTLDNAGTVKARVQDGTRKSYDYTPAVEDMMKAVSLDPDFPYSYYNLGNLYCLSGELPEAIAQYTEAIRLYPNLAEAYYNRGLVQIYVQDREKGCMDLSKAGELGIEDAYGVIKKYCTPEE